MAGLAHPCGVQPEGNLLLLSAAVVNCRNAGLGRLGCLNDHLLLVVLGDEALNAADVARFACCSKAAYCFADNEELWKAWVLQVRKIKGGQNRAQVARNNSTVSMQHVRFRTFKASSPGVGAGVTAMWQARKGGTLLSHWQQRAARCHAVVANGGKRWLLRL
jgi:hypothetical protein